MRGLSHNPRTPRVGLGRVKKLSLFAGRVNNFIKQDPRVGKNPDPRITSAHIVGKWQEWQMQFYAQTKP